MFSFGKSLDSRQIIAALSKSQAMIQFDLTGKILTANENFCNALGYSLQAALEEILVQVQEINLNVSAIVEAAQEQSTGLKEINQAVNSMDQATQQNAAMVEESTAASHNMSREAEALHTLLRQFRIGQEPATIETQRHADDRPQTTRLHATARAMRGGQRQALAVAPSNDGSQNF